MRRTTHQSVYTQHPHCSYSNIHGHHGSSITGPSPLPHQVHLCRLRCACSITAAWSQQPLIMFPDVEGIFYHLAACPSSACQRESIHCKDGNHGNCSYIVIQLTFLTNWRQSASHISFKSSNYGIFCILSCNKTRDFRSFQEISINSSCHLVFVGLINPVIIHFVQCNSTPINFLLKEFIYA